MALRDVLQAIFRNWRVVRRADWDGHAGAHAGAKTLVGVLLEERDEARGRAERLGQSHQHTLEKLSVSQRDLQEARAALDASERGLAAAQAALARRTAALDTAQAETGAARAEMDVLRRQLAEADSEKADLAAEADAANGRADALRARLAGLPPDPPPFNVAYVSTPVAVVRAAIEPILAKDYITGRTTPPDYDDTAYNLFHPMDIVPFCDYWRANLMPPARGEESDCFERAIAFCVDLHRWSGYTIRAGCVQVTADWALVNGERWPHYIPIAVAPDGTPWCIDPAFLAQPEPYSKERVQVLRGLFY